jgi:hypothetical protein
MEEDIRRKTSSKNMDSIELILKRAVATCRTKQEQRKILEVIFTTLEIEKDSPVYNGIMNW